MFEPGAKHTFDQAAGKGVANPTAALLASAKMLQVMIITTGISWKTQAGAKHTFDQAAGKYVANPIVALLASAKMLQVIILKLNRLLAGLTNPTAALLASI